MVNSDYGKLAYLKIAELERKIEALESKVDESSYMELEFLYNNLEYKRTHTFITNFNALKNCTSNIEILLDNLISGDAYAIIVKVNDVQLYKQANIKEAQNSFSLQATLTKGENVIAVSVENLTCDFNLPNLKIKVGGFVEYQKTKNYLSYISDFDCEYILHLNGNNATLFNIALDEKLINLYSINNVLDCKIAGLIESYLYILYINTNNNLYICKYNLKTSEEEIIDLNISSCTSVAGYPSDNGIKIYFSKFAKIYSGVYEQNSHFYPTFTGRKGLEIYIDASVPNGVVIVDNFLNAKFITD